jgi:Spo7-like protein
MSEASLDQLVKGAPPPNVSLPSVAAQAIAHSPSPPSDPTLHIPASPPQIYLNLLILEASLRSQYLTLRARRRQNTFVLTLLCLWIAYFFYCQFLRPREDGTGVGGSVYWVLDMFEKVALISGAVMGVLFRLTGQWERGVRWPSRWLRTTNRGLRGMNCKVVVLKGPWWRELISSFGFLLPLSYFVENPGSNYQFVEYPIDPLRRKSQPTQRRIVGDKAEVAEEDIAAGGDYIKILLLPKHFTPEFRDNWETYRAEYWDAENARRTDLRARIRARRKALAKQHSPWLWWLPGRSLASAHSGRRELVRAAENVTRTASTRHKRAASIIKEKEREGSHSRSSSRSSIPPDNEERHERRWSTSTTSSIGGTERRRRKVGTSSESSETKRASFVGPSGRVKLTPATGSRPSTPTSGDGMKRFSTVSSGSEGDSPGRVKIKLESLD